MALLDIGHNVTINTRAISHARWLPVDNDPHGQWTVTMIDGEIFVRRGWVSQPFEEIMRGTSHAIAYLEHQQSAEAVS